MCGAKLNVKEIEKGLKTYENCQPFFQKSIMMINTFRSHCLLNPTQINLHFLVKRGFQAPHRKLIFIAIAKHLHIGIGSTMQPGIYWAGLLTIFAFYNRAARPYALVKRSSDRRKSVYGV